MTPGIYAGLSADEYHADPCPAPSLSASLAKVLLNRSPAHAWQMHPRLNTAYVPEEDTRFDIGTAAHALLLEGEDCMIEVDADDWRTKSAKEARDAARESGKLPILSHQADDVRRMVEVTHAAIVACSDFGYTLDQGAAETSLFWHEGGAWCRARPDWLSNDHKIILDYKTTSDASPEAFMRQIVRMAYDVQAGHYCRGLHALTGTLPQFIFLAQEITPPYACCFVGLPPVFMSMAEEKASLAIGMWQDCMRSGQWPAYPSRIHWVEPPGYEQSRWQERMESSIGTDWIDLATTA